MRRSVNEISLSVNLPMRFASEWGRVVGADASRILGT